MTNPVKQSPDFVPFATEAAAPETKESPDFVPFIAGTEGHTRPQRGRPLDNASDDNYATGTLKNLGSTIIEGIGGIPGMVGNMRDFGQYAVDRARSYMNGKPVEQVAKERAEAEEKDRVEQALWFKKTYGRDMPTRHKSLIEQAPTGEQVMSPLTHFTGEYEPQSDEGRYGRMGGSMAISMLAPGPKGVKIANGARVPLSTVMKEGGKEVGKKLGEGFGLGVATQGVTDTTGDPLIAAAVTPAYMGAKSVVRRVTNPNPGARKMVERDATDLDRLRSMVDDESKYEIVPGSMPTTPQLTGDVGLADAQRAAALEPGGKFKQQLEGQLRGQNEARVEHLQGMVPGDADTQAAPQIFKNIRKGLEAESERLHDTIPENPNVAESGESLRTEGRKQRAEIARRVSDIYGTLDPEGRIEAPTPKLKDVHKELRGLNPLYHDVAPEVEAVLKKIDKHPENHKFSDIVAFDKTLTAAIEDAPTANARRQLKQLKSALGSDIDNMAENVHAQQQAAVARGELDPNSTWEAALKRQLAEHMQGKQGANLGARTANGAVDLSPGVSGEAGPTSRSGPGNAGSAGGLPGDDAYMQQLAEQLKQGKALRAEQGKRFDNTDPVASAVEAGSDVKGGTVAKSAFPGGDNGYLDTKAWLDANQNHPQTVTDLQNIAMARLREQMKNGELSPERLEAWKKKYRTSLMAIDEVSPGFSSRFNAVGEATKALDDFHESTRASVAAADTPAKMSSLMGSIINSADGETQLANIMPHIINKPEALQGVRRAALNHLLDNKGMVSADGTIRGDALAKHIRDKEPILKQLYGSNFENMQAVADDLARAQAATRQSAITGSPTEYNRALTHDSDGHGHPLTTGGALLVSAVAHAHPTAAAVAAAAAGAWKGFKFLKGWNEARASRVYKEALLNPKAMKLLLSEGAPGGMLNIAAMNELVSMTEGQEQLEHQRQGHAAGGAVKVDHAARAASLVRAVPRVRKEISAGTAPMLKLSDNVITKALAIANQGLN